MKVCMLTTSFPRFRGDYAGAFLLELAKELVKQGTEVRVVTPGDPLAAGQEVVEGIEIVRFQYALPKRLQRLAYRHGGITVALKKDPIARLQLPGFLASFLNSAAKWARGCDLIHAHWVGSGLMAILPKMALHKPALLTTRGTDVKLLDESNLWRRMFDFTLRRVDLVTTVSERHRTKIVERGFDRDKVFLIPNGIDIRRFENANGEEARRELGLPTERRIALFVGNLIEIKGLNYLVETVPMVRKKAEDFLLILVGDGNLKGPLAREISECGLSDWVRMVGTRPASEIPLWMNAADVLVLPSLSEGRPNVVLEAMACETPVVATAVGGTPELVKDGEVGFLIPPESSESIAEKVLLLLRDKELREGLGKNGRKFVVEEGLTWESCAKRFSEIYCSLVTQR